MQALVARYLRVLSFALPASLMFRAVYALNVAVSRPKVVMILQGTGLALKVVLSYVLIFGHLGLPRLGAVGCAVASFTLMALLIARLGTSVMGGHQITMNLAALSYQIPLALAIATATVTAQAVGAGDLREARRAAATGIRVGVGVASLTAVALWAFRRPIVGLYTSDTTVAAVALSLIGYLIAFHVFDALQGITAFVLRAYKIVMLPAVIYSVALWGLGLVGGYVVAFRPLFGAPRGAAGMWLMQAVALFVTSVLLFVLYLWVLKRGHPARRPAPLETVISA